MYEKSVLPRSCPPSSGLIAALLVLLVLAGCAVRPAAATDQNSPTDQAGNPAAGSENAENSEETEAAEPSLDERLDALLAETLPEEAYRETKRCLSRYDYRKISILNQEYLLFSKGDRYWLNKLRHRCVSLNHNMILTTNVKGTSSICQSDHVYTTSRFDLERGFDSSGRPIAAQGVCTLGEFESITAEQAELLREIR